MDVRFPKGSLGLRIEREAATKSVNDTSSRVPRASVVPDPSGTNTQDLINPTELERESFSGAVRSDAVQAQARPTKTPSSSPPVRDIESARRLVGGLLANLSDSLQTEDGGAESALSAHNNLDPIMVAALTGQDEELFQ